MGRFRSQLTHAQNELTGSYYSTQMNNAGWQNVNSTDSATDIVLNKYEVAPGQAVSRRRKAARQAYETFSGKDISSMGYDSYSSDSSTTESKHTMSNFFSDLYNMMSNALGRLYGFETDDTDTSSTTDSSYSGSYTINDSNATEVGKKVSQLAMQQVGKQYVFGTRGPNTFDCSGLCQWCYKTITGVDIGATTYIQRDNSSNVPVGSVSNIKPGDIILCHGSSGDYGHVGMYVGNGQVVHAASGSRGVVSDSLDSFISYHQPIDIRRPSVASGGVDVKLKKPSNAIKKLIKSNKSKNKVSEKVANSWWNDKLKTGGMVTSNFGIRKNPFGSGYSSHTGIDYGSDSGTPIYSPIGGTVIENDSTNESGGYGNLVVVQDKNGANHYFGHMKNKSPLKPGTRIEQGQEVGEVGSTGNSTGPHLHYETRVNNTPVDPNVYLNKYGEGGIDESIDEQIENIRKSISDNIEKSIKYEDNKNSKSVGGVDTNIVPSSDTTMSIKLLNSILSTLVKVADNTNLLNQVIQLLSKVAGVSTTNTSTNSSTKNNGNYTTSSTRTAESNVQSSDMNMQSLIALMNKLATE